MPSDERCRTPDCEWYLHAGDRGVCVEVEFPDNVGLTRAEAGSLNVAMHDAIEGVIAPLFANRFNRITDRPEGVNAEVSTDTERTAPPAAKDSLLPAAPAPSGPQL